MCTEQEASGLRDMPEPPPNLHSQQPEAEEEKVDGHQEPDKDPGQASTHSWGCAVPQRIQIGARCRGRMLHQEDKKAGRGSSG